MMGEKALSHDPFSYIYDMLTHLQPHQVFYCYPLSLLYYHMYTEVNESKIKSPYLSQLLNVECQ